jgi:hypothetical protein
MAIVQLILSGEGRVTLHDTFDYPLVLQFGQHRDYDSARWVIPSFGYPLPAFKVSEIRVDEGALSVLIDGPDGFRSGPHPVTWVRGYYPRGKHCALLYLDPETQKLGGVMIQTIEGSLVVEDFFLEVPPKQQG